MCLLIHVACGSSGVFRESRSGVAVTPPSHCPRVESARVGRRAGGTYAHAGWFWTQAGTRWLKLPRAVRQPQPVPGNSAPLRRCAAPCPPSVFGEETLPVPPCTCNSIFRVRPINVALRSEGDFASGTCAATPRPHLRDYRIIFTDATPPSPWSSHRGSAPTAAPLAFTLAHCHARELRTPAGRP